MGKTNLSPRDVELLSAYLDKELSPKDTAHLEARLWKDANLRNALDEFDRTRMMLRSLPRVRAPRNFTLSPQVARQKASPRLYPLFGFASALAAVLLIAILAGDWMGLWLPARVAYEPATPKVTAPEVADETPFTDDTAATENLVITETPSAALKMPGQSSPTVTMTELPPSQTPSATSTATVEPSAVPETVATSDIPSPTHTERETGMAFDDTQTPLPSATPTETPPPTVTPTQTVTLEPSATPTLTPTVTPSPTATLIPTDTPAVEVAMQSPTQTIVPTMPPEPPLEETLQAPPQTTSGALGDQPVLLVLEVGLAFLLILMVAAGLWSYLRR